MGISYGGAAAEFLLVNQHPAVKAVAPLFSGFDLYPELAFPGGIHLAWFTRTWTYINNQLDQNLLPFSGWGTTLFVRGVKTVDEDEDGSLTLASFDKPSIQLESSYRSFRNCPFEMIGPPSPQISTIDKLSTHHYTNEIQASGAVIYSYSGWFDGAYPLSAIKRHLTYQQKSNKLILGPWDHGGKYNISHSILVPPNLIIRENC